MKKKAAKITAFLLAVVLGITGVACVFDFKYLDSIFKMEMFYRQEDNTVDVLVLGSSHSYQGVNTAVLWEEYGYAAYDLCGSAQPMWNTYYYLEEALKTQKPKAIILDAYTVHYSTEYSDSSFAIKNTYGLKWSDTKKAAIEASFDTEAAGNQYFYSILQYHSRYSDLNRTDFYPYQANRQMYENHKGFYCYFYTTPIENKELSNVNYTDPIEEKSLEYYRKTIELAQSNNIPIIITAIPFAADEYHQAFFNSAEEVANEYGVPFYNFIGEYKAALGLDYSVDFSDAQHLNFRGNTKLTRFLGNILKENYDIPDRRGDSAYESWDKDAMVFYNQLENYNVTQIESLNDYMQIFTKNRFSVVLTSSGYGKADMSNGAEEQTHEFFTALGITEEEYTRGGMWVIKDGAITDLDDCSGRSFAKAVRLGSADDLLVKAVETQNEEGESIRVNALFYNKEDVTVCSRGINIFVYDTFTESRVDTVCFNYINGKFYRKA